MKYRLTDETVTIKIGVTLHRIEALQSFGLVRKGDLGGFVESENNLSQEGLAWLFYNARVFGNTKIDGNARVGSNAWVDGNARIGGSARVTRTPKVLTGFPYTVTITDHHIRAGCEQHPPSVWRDCGAAIIRAQGYKTERARRWLTLLLNIADEHGCVDPKMR